MTPVIILKEGKKYVKFPTIAEPDISGRIYDSLTSDELHDYAKATFEYQDHLASLPRFPLDESLDHLPVGEMKGYRGQWQRLKPHHDINSIDPWENCTKEGYEQEDDGHTRIHPVKIEGEREVVKDTGGVLEAYGLITRYCGYNENYGFGCSECCNGDRCDEDCTAVYKGRRKECPHCKGEGWIPKYVVTKFIKDTPHPTSLEGEKELNDVDWNLKRLYDWVIDEKRKPAITAFTSGWLRNVAREIEYRLEKPFPKPLNHKP